MSEKLVCLGCNSYTSSVYQAYEEGEPCPYCGLVAEVTRQVLDARRRNADEELLRLYQEAEVRAGKAEAAVARLQRQLDAIRRAVQDLDGDTP